MPSNLLFWAGLLLVGMSTACSLGGSTTRQNNEAILPEITETVTVKKKWQRSLGKDSHTYKLLPLLIGERLFVAKQNGIVYSIDSKTGKTLWKKKLSSQLTAGLGNTDDLLLIGSSEGEMLAILMENGELKWQGQVPSEILAVPLGTAHNLIIVRSTDGKITALNAINGEWIWNHEMTVPALSVRGISAPITYEDMLIAGFANGRVALLETISGKLIGEMEIVTPSGRSELDKLADIDATPLVADDIIYIGSFQKKIAAIHIQTNRILWSRDISIYKDPIIIGDYLYLIDAMDHIHAINRLTGESIWLQQQLAGRQLTAPVVSKDHLITGDKQGYLHFLDKKNGTLVGRLQHTDTAIKATPIVTSKTLYVYAQDGKLSAYAY